MEDIESGVYKIRNIINDKCYIGSTVNFRRRWYKHKYDLKRNKHINQHLQNAWNKYDSDNFVFEVIAKCEKSALIETEQHYLDVNMASLYNKTKIAGRPVFTFHSDESKAKISLSLKKLYKNKENHPMFGKSRSEETKLRISSAKQEKQKSFSDEEKQRISAGTKIGMARWALKRSEDSNVHSAGLGIKCTKAGRLFEKRATCHGGFKDGDL